MDENMSRVQEQLTESVFIHFPGDKGSYFLKIIGNFAAFALKDKKATLPVNMNFKKTQNRKGTQTVCNS